MRKEERVELRITKEEKKFLQADAKKEGRSISNLLVQCWKQWREGGKTK